MNTSTKGTITTIGLLAVPMILLASDGVQQASEKLDIVSVLGYVTSVIVALLHAYKMHQAGVDKHDIADLIINTLKDETKLTNGQFKLSTINKMEAVAKELKVSESVCNEVKSVILSGRETGIKIGSWKGKPLFVSDLAKGFGLIQGIRKLFK